MPQNFFANHKDLLDNALTALRTREYWSPWPEMPSPKAYGETANQEGKQAFEARLNRPFALDQPGAAEWVGNEESPFGFPLGITYPKPEINALMHAAEAAAQDWRKAGPESWTGVALESLVRLNRRSFEMAYAVMHTTGQAFLMAFQAGGPHAQDRGLEAVAYAWSEMSGIPKAARWEKPQGKNPPLKMQKNYRIVPRGIGLVIGCCTFPTWNSYPGLFADLATGNAVIVKPHPGAVLPLAITVEVIRQVLADAGFNPNVITLGAHSKGDDFAQQLALRPEVKLIDFTGSSEHGNWLEQNARQAQIFAEKSGVNQIVIDSTDDLKGMIRNIAFSLSLYSAQMCTAPQNIYVSQGGIDTPEGRLSFDQVASAIGDGIQKLLGDPARAVEVLGAIQNEEILKRVDKAHSLAEVVLDSKPLEHPEFKNARIRTPLLLKAEARDKDKFMCELFGPISFIIKTDDTQQSIDLARRGAIDHGALAMSVYSTNEHVLRNAENAAAEAGVTLSCNLTGGVYVNQSAAFSDFHGSGMNPAANASITDTAFVANRFRVAETRSHA